MDWCADMRLFFFYLSHRLLQVSEINVLLWDKEIPPEDQNNSSETRLCQVFDKIIRVRGWDFLVQQQYIMIDTFSHPLFDFLRFFNMNSVSPSYFFFRFFTLVPIWKKKLIFQKSV